MLYLKFLFYAELWLNHQTVGIAFKKEFFHIFVPKTIDDILNLDWYDEEMFPYIDQREEHSGWTSFWNQFCQ